MLVRTATRAYAASPLPPLSALGPRLLDPHPMPPAPRLLDKLKAQHPS